MVSTVGNSWRPEPGCNGGSLIASDRPRLVLRISVAPAVHETRGTSPTVLELPGGGRRTTAEITHWDEPRRHGLCGWMNDPG
jgi:hypothetical protein